MTHEPSGGREQVRERVMPPDVITEQRRGEIDQSSLGAVQEPLDIDEVLTLNSRLLLCQPEPRADICGRAGSISEISQRRKVSALGWCRAIPPISMEAAVSLLLGDAVGRASGRHVDRRGRSDLPRVLSIRLDEKGVVTAALEQVRERVTLIRDSLTLGREGQGCGSGLR